MTIPDPHIDRHFAQLTDHFARMERKLDQQHSRHESFQEKALRKLDHIERQVRNLMTDVTEVTQSLEALKTDLEAKAAEAKAEFDKLEAELAAAGTPVELTPLKEAIDGIDSSVKAAVVPSA